MTSVQMQRISNLNKKSRNAVVHTPKLGRTDMPNARYEVFCILDHLKALLFTWMSYTEYFILFVVPPKNW